MSVLRKIFVLLVLVSFLGAPPSMAQDDPTFGTAYYEFECGGDNANDGGVNTPEDAHAWWVANSSPGGGTPYTAASPNVYRAATAGSQEWIYEFDLPDSASTVFLRMEAHQTVRVSITGPQNVDAGNHQTFSNGIVVFEQAGMDHAAVSVDLSDYLNNAQVYDTSRKIYLKFEGYDNGNASLDNNALVFHVRLDNGFPSFSIGGGFAQYDDAQFIAQSNGAGLAMSASDPTQPIYRYTDMDKYVIYALTVPAGLGQAWVSVQGFQQYEWSLGSQLAGTFDVFATGAAQNAYNLTVEVADLSPYLDATSQEAQVVYLKMADSEPATGWGGGYLNVNVTQNDPRVGDSARAFGHVFYEFEAGGDTASGYDFANSQPLPTTNVPELAALWFGLNSVAGPTGQYAYTSAYTPDVYRAADGSQFWIYEFDLPDDQTTAFLRMEAHQGISVSITGPQNVDPADPTVFNNGTVIFQQSSMSHTAVSVDLTSYLAAANVADASKKFYLKFEPYNGQSALLFHLRIDDGWPSFACGGNLLQNDDAQFIAAASGAGLSWDNSVDQPWIPRFRYADQAGYIIYDLNMPSDATNAWLSVYGLQQYSYAIGTDPGGPWTEFASSLNASAYNVKSEVLDLAPYLSASADNHLYMLLRDKETTNGWGGCVGSIQVTPYDPMADVDNVTSGTVYAEFETGGTGANGQVGGSTNTTNYPESYYSWWIANSPVGNGTPYTTGGAFCFRAADTYFSGGTISNQQNWTYRFDLPDDADQVVLRLRLTGNIDVYLGDASMVNATNREYFNTSAATKLFEGRDLQVDEPGGTVVSLDLTSHLASNATKEFYVHMRPPADAQEGGYGAVTWHLRIDNGWPGFPTLGNHKRFNSDVFIGETNGSFANDEFRAVSGSQYMTYVLDLDDSVTSAVAYLDVEGEYELGVSKSANGPFTRIASSEFSGADRVTLDRDLAEYLVGNATNTVYLRLSDTHKLTQVEAGEVFDVEADKAIAGVIYQIVVAEGSGQVVELPVLNRAGSSWTLY